MIPIQGVNTYDCYACLSHRCEEGSCTAHTCVKVEVKDFNGLRPFMLTKSMLFEGNYNYIYGCAKNYVDESCDEESTDWPIYCGNYYFNSNST